MEVYIATYTILQYTLNDHIHTICSESIHSSTPKSDKYIPGHVILAALFLRPTCMLVSVYYTLPHVVFLTATHQCSQVQQTAIHKQ